jgi:hypothetical protein
MTTFLEKKMNFFFRAQVLDFYYDDIPGGLGDGGVDSFPPPHAWHTRPRT